MENRASILLSTEQIIDSQVQKNTYGFSAVDTMGNLVVNKKYKKGYDEFADRKLTEKSYIWQALSAITEDISETVYSNVINYIDNVSNVDTCEIKSLRSMLELLGINYRVIDKVQYYPIEIQHLISLLSMNKKYLFNNKYMKQDFIDTLSIDSVISGYDIVGVCADYDTVSSSIDYYVHNKLCCDSYMLSTYYNFIYDILDMPIVPYDQVEDLMNQLSTQLCNTLSINQLSDFEPLVKAYRQITTNDGYGPNQEVEIDKYFEQKKMLNIDQSFNVEDIVNAIEVGQISLDDFHGDELTLLLEEIDARKSMSFGLSGKTFNAMAARNAYYRKNKVIQYAKFVDNIVGNSLSSQISDYQTYAYDPSYYINTNEQNGYVIQNIGSQVADPCIDLSYVKKAAENLVNITNYISKIRERIRLHVRKVFMKGTNNLLEFAANEFLIDYAEQLKNTFPMNKISSIVAALSAHRIGDVCVQEYWDNTEYMNISAVTSNRYAYNYRRVNPRYFDSVFSRDGDDLVPEDNCAFTNPEINEFYLSTLGLKNDLAMLPIHNTANASKLSSNFYDFLSVLFDVAANPSYYDIEHNVFGTQLSNQIITHDIYNDLQWLNEISARIMAIANRLGFSFSSLSTVGEQITELENEYNDALQEQYLSAVDELVNLYSPDLQQISGDLEGEAAQLSIYLNQTYAHYFCKSTNSYSYGSNGEYLFEYFVGNPNFLRDDYFILQLNEASAWIKEHCETYPLSNAISILSGQYDDIKGRIYNEIVNNISLSGFIDLKLVDLAEEMDSVKGFLDSSIIERKNYLQIALDNFRTQANELKNTYQQLDASFQSVLGSLPDMSQNFYFKYIGPEQGTYAVIGQSSSTPGAIFKKYSPVDYDKYSKSFFYTSDNNKFNCFSKVNFDIMAISADAPLKNNINSILQNLTNLNEAYYGASSIGNAPTKTYGTQTDTLNSLLAGLTKLDLQLNNIVDQVKEMYQLDDAVANSLKTTSDNGANVDVNIYDKILNLIKFLGTQIAESNFNNDLILASYNSYLSTLTNISGEYIPVRNEYEVLWSKFASFLTAYEKTSDYKVFKPENLDKLESYRKKTDAESLEKIEDDFGNLYDRYETSLNKFIAICDNRITLYKSMTQTYVYKYTGDVLEECLISLTNALDKDSKIKTEIGVINIQNAIDALNDDILAVSDDLYKKYFPTVIGTYETLAEYEKAFRAQLIPFDDIMDKLFDLLNYNGYSTFNESKMMFQNYTGIASQTLSTDQFVAEDPYYNHKNLTHPSFQIHPFLWNFTEKALVKSAIDVIANAYVNIDMPELESVSIISNIDRYIGKFGNLIDVWRNNTKDFTSYQTRYERSAHICKFTGISSEVVDYDGGFYPPALTQYLSNRSWSNMSKWYQHLQLENDEFMLNTIQDCLSNASNFSKIQNATKNAALSNVYDIFKYQLDNYGNAYILYKKYAVENPSYHDKLLTTGEFWIRPADSPIAFPVMKNAIDYSKSYQGLANFSNSMVDFDILEAGEKLIASFKNSNGDVQTIGLNILYNLQPMCGLGQLTFTTTDPDLSDQNIYQYAVVPNLNDASSMMYLGSYPRGSTAVDVVYVQYDKASQRINDDPKLTIYSYKFNNNIEFMTNSKANVKNIVRGTYPSIAYYSDIIGRNNYLDVAFLTNNSDIESKQATRLISSQISVNLSTDTEGAIFSDPLNDIMNSFDVFNETIQIAKIQLNDPELEPTNTIYQTNTDIGYIPSYPGLSANRPLMLSNEIIQTHLPIELLGKSTDLDSIKAMINDSPNPYLDKDEIQQKYLMGRVYENGHGDLSDTQFSLDLDKSLYIFSNQPMYSNMPTSIVDGYCTYVYQTSPQKRFVWSIDVGKMYDSVEQIKKLKLFMYSTTCLGKNPYIVDDLSNIIAGDAKYDSSDGKDKTTLASMYPYQVRVTGTQNGVNEIDYNYSNYIDGVDELKYEYNALNNTLSLFFNLADENQKIARDSVKVALVDNFNLKFFEQFHLLDPGLTKNEAIQKLNEIAGQPFTSAEMLAVDLAQYDHLSDVQIDGHKIFDTYWKMAFKVDENEISAGKPFELNYFVPNLNIKYPLTFGQTFYQNYMKGEASDNLVGIYQNDNVFVVKLQSYNQISAYRVQIDTRTYDAFDEVRAYEDYLDVEQTYLPEDPRLFEHIHFMATNKSAGEINVPDASCTDVCIDYASNNNDKFSKWITDNNLYVNGYDKTADNALASLGAFRIIDFVNKFPSDKRGKIIRLINDRLALYISYKKTSNGIALYVNYQNGLNSPFIDIDGNKAFSVVVDGTYAKIEPDSSANVAINLQFQAYFDGKLVGCANVNAAQYQIFNISDDKPKLLVKRLNSI